MLEQIVANVINALSIGRGCLAVVSIVILMVGVVAVAVFD